MNVILDLDNTIINALEEHERESIPLDFQNQFQYHDLTPYGMRIFARPGLQDFLDFLFANFKVTVFTAAEQEYALFIINNFLLTNPKRKLEYCFFRYHVDIAHKHSKGTKDLRLLFNIFNVKGFYPCNTVIIDDLIDVYESNPDNTIRIRSFDVAHEGGAMNKEAVNDKELIRVQKYLEDLNERYKRSDCPRQIFLGQTPKITSPFDLV